MSAPPSPTLDRRALADLAEAVARRSGRLLLDGLHRHRTLVETKSTGTDMVSEMDWASEQLIVAALLASRPDDGVVGEEGSAVAGTSGLRWVIDPLDGTTNYLYAIPGWGVSIAAETAEGVVAGVVFDPVHDQLFRATAGGGASCNGEPIAASPITDLGLALVATGFGYHPDRRRAQAEVLAGLIGDIRDIRRIGAAAVDLCSVACGRVDAFYERGLQWWDLAAGGLIAIEAGAVVVSLDGDGPPLPGSVLAAAPGIANPLRERLSALRAGDVP
ncbi:MAG TPA: inositol monophosphatase family protein [Acidimicrobiales bacterium]|nr:inositol monophosphatase family protein [Acidimicrobiales bacterium]